MFRHLGVRGGLAFSADSIEQRSAGFIPEILVHELALEGPLQDGLTEPLYSRPVWFEVLFYHATDSELSFDLYNDPVLFDNGWERHRELSDLGREHVLDQAARIEVIYTPAKQRSLEPPQDERCLNECRGKSSYPLIEEAVLCTSVMQTRPRHPKKKKPHQRKRRWGHNFNW